jgi:predicted TIM-barrel fold metal-dependent hydrolase
LSIVKPEQAEIVTPDPIHSIIRNTLVIDTDFHFTPEFSSIHKYLKEPFKTKVKGYPLTGADYDARYAISVEDTGLNIQGKARNAEEALQAIDKIGVDQVILSPGLRPISYFNGNMSSSLASAYNDYMINEVFPVSSRLKASIMINQRDPFEAAKEIRRVGVHEGFVSVYSEFGATEQLGDAKFDPIYDALTDFDFPLIMHASGFYPARSPFASGSRTWSELIGVGWPTFAAAHIGSMIFQGLFDKYKDLKVLVQEGGLWWIIDFMLRLDEFYLDHPGDIQMVERKLESGEKFLNKMPSDYVLDHIRFSTQPMSKPKSATHYKYLLEMCHAEKLLLYSSDWPHVTYDPANWVVENNIIPEETQKRILSENAKELFKRLR